MYVHFQRFVNPTPFGLTYGIEYLFMTVLGGAGFLPGAILGSGIITALRELLVDYLPSLIGQSGNYETIVLAVLIIFILHRAPEGLWPRLLKALKVQEVQDRLREAGITEIVNGSPDAATKFVQSEYQRWGNIIRQLNLKAN
jgi:branched-chain amino acid transport system permease protein